MSKAYIGIDNGVTGSIGVIRPNDVYFIPTPSKKEQSYTKKKQNISRVDVMALQEHFLFFCEDVDARVVIERPLVNPGMFKATLSAMRALEATLTVLERLEIGYEYIDSKEWQKALLPTGTKGSTELKKASMDIGKRLYPHLSDVIDKQKDADGLLIAHYLMTKYK